MALTKRAGWALSAMAALAVGCVSPASATSVSLTANAAGAQTNNSTWTPFYFEGPVSQGAPTASWLTTTPPGGTPASLSDLSSVDYQFTLTSPAYFDVTDSFISGDQFNVAISGGSILSVLSGSCTGSTCTTTTPTANDFQSTFSGAFADANFSTLSVLLGPGTYDVTGSVILSAFYENIPAVINEQCGTDSACIAFASLSQGAVDLISATPIPASWALFLAGVVGFGFVSRFRRSKGERQAAAA